MNFHYLIQRVFGKATCNLGRRSRLFMSARIRNLLKDNDRINIGDETIVKGELLVFAHGGKISIGEWCYIGEGARIWSAALISIGDRVMISHNVNIFDSLTHPLSAKARHRQFVAITSVGHPSNIDLGEKDVIIGDDVLIGTNSTILRGVSIGRGSIVGAGSVVTHNIPPWTIVAGNPARLVREIPVNER
jgi:acetyltransferase-like isoleucine patch superfamily enzyme